ncbi:sigma-70 family RNA polymerase sigma factor [Paenarthrobacter sp. CCNWLY172]|uniref:sigma-70 family RNA polymerase sigma factor n=1 Tax=unclassified Paenarthrobacter TaxID=2634190 RepID=UPI003077A656
MGGTAPADSNGRHGTGFGGDGNGAVADSDMDLVLQVRAGQRTAFEVLFERHQGVARKVAAAQVNNYADVDDVVADAFTSVYQSITAGKGPDTFFRAYLLTAVRRFAYQTNRGASRTRPTAESFVLDSAVFHDDPAVAHFESKAVTQAFRSLPERWQEVLWYVDIEGLKPAAVSPLIGLTPNGVSALALRARERLRQVYLQNHITSSTGDSCEQYSTQLGAYSRDGLRRRSQDRVRAHLEGCPKCTALLLDLNDVQSAMRAVVFPLVAGAAFTSVFPALAAVGAGTGVGAGLVHGMPHREMAFFLKVGAGVMAVAAVSVGAAVALSGAGSNTAEVPVAEVSPTPRGQVSYGPDPAVPGAGEQDQPQFPAPNEPSSGAVEKPAVFPFPVPTKPAPRGFPAPSLSWKNPLFPTFAPTGPPTLPALVPLPGATPTPSPTSTQTPTATPSPTSTATPSPSSTATPSPAPNVTATFRAVPGTTASDTNITITFTLQPGPVPSNAEVVFAISAGADMIPGKLIEPAGWNCSSDDAATRQFRCSSNAVDPDALEFLLGVSKQDEGETTTLDYQFSGTGIETATFSNTF